MKASELIERGEHFIGSAKGWVYLRLPESAFEKNGIEELMDILSEIRDAMESSGEDK